MLKGNILIRPTCKWLYERRNEYIPSAVWKEPGNICHNLQLSFFFFHFIPSPSPLSFLKEINIHNWARWSFRTFVCHLYSLVFKKKTPTIPCSNISFLSFLACCVASGLSNNQTTKSTSKVGHEQKGREKPRAWIDTLNSEENIRECLWANLNPTVTLILMYGLLDKVTFFFLLKLLLPFELFFMFLKYIFLWTCTSYIEINQYFVANVL